MDIEYDVRYFMLLFATKHLHKTANFKQGKYMIYILGNLIRERMANMPSCK